MARRRKSRSPLKLVAMVVLLAAVGWGLWWFDAAFEERHWREFQAAGERACERGNVDFAERLLLEAVQYAEHQGNVEHAVVSCTSLRQLYMSRGDPDAAAGIVARARALRRSR
jgi:hypothetical protein